MVVLFIVFLLGLLRSGIFFDALADRSCNYLDFLVQSFDFCIEFCEVGNDRPHHFAGLDDLLSAAHQLIVCFQEHPLNDFCVQGGGLAPRLALELAVAAPYFSAVGIRGVPHLFAVKDTAVSADQLYEPQTLIVVYKDEMLANQIKKLIETKDDAEGAVTGTRDNSINVVTWTEKVWLANKKAGNITSKVLFLGDIKGVDALIPVIDVV